MKKLIIAATIATLSMPSLAAKSGLEYSIGTGTAFSYAEGITIDMDNGDKVDLGSVDFDTKPFASPPYYNLRFGNWKDGKAWEIEFIHHKIYADKEDLGQGVEKLEITDGYNLLYANHAYESEHGLIYRFGAGIVIPHPDVTYNGQRSHGGYQLGGISAQLGLEKEFPINENWIFSIESKVTYSHAKIELDFGEATVPNTAFHLVGNLKFNH